MFHLSQFFYSSLFALTVPVRTHIFLRAFYKTIPLTFTGPCYNALKNIAENCCSNLRVSAEKHHLSLSCQCRSAVLSADSDLVKELLENLIQNAIQYNRENGFIVVRTGLQNGCPFLSVLDSGIGIPRSERERIFERFYRTDKSRSRETGGTGLGLAIVKHIAEIHDAKITVDSEVEQGTCITVLFKASAPGSQDPSAI